MSCGKNKKLSMERVRINKQGYANRGRDYWGVGQPLFAWSMEYESDLYGKDYVQGYLRAASAKEARRLAKAEAEKAICKEEASFKRVSGHGRSGFYGQLGGVKGLKRCGLGGCTVKKRSSRRKKRR